MCSNRDVWSWIQTSWDEQPPERASPLVQYATIVGRLLFPIIRSVSLSQCVTPPSISLGFCGMGQELFWCHAPPTIKSEAVIAGSICAVSECSSECSGVSEEGKDQQPWMTYIKQRWVQIRLWGKACNNQKVVEHVACLEQTFELCDQMILGGSAGTHVSEEV